MEIISATKVYLRVGLNLFTGIFYLSSINLVSVWGQGRTDDTHANSTQTIAAFELLKYKSSSFPTVNAGRRALNNKSKVQFLWENAADVHHCLANQCICYQ